MFACNTRVPVIIHCEQSFEPSILISQENNRLFFNEFRKNQWRKTNRTLVVKRFDADDFYDGTLYSYRRNTLTFWYLRLVTTKCKTISSLFSPLANYKSFCIYSYIKTGIFCRFTDQVHGCQHEPGQVPWSGRSSRVLDESMGKRILFWYVRTIDCDSVLLIVRVSGVLGRPHCRRSARRTRAQFRAETSYRRGKLLWSMNNRI